MARILLMSDIHANLPALEAVLEDASLGLGFDQAWLLGDLVGYGPDPNECLERIRSLDALVVAGNHDAAAIGRIPGHDFNPYALKAVLWTLRTLSEESREYLSGLPEIIQADRVTLAHGSPRQPMWEYLRTASSALANLDHFATQGCAVGHTHMPFMVRVRSGMVEQAAAHAGTPVPIGEDRFYVNPGSVGQPRDGDPRASYAVLDLVGWTAEFRRVGYDIRTTQDRIRAAGLPDILADRLPLGQ